MRFFVFVPTLLLAIEAVPVKSYPFEDATRSVKQHGEIESNFLSKRRCQPGTIHCPYEVTPPPEIGPPDAEYGPEKHRCQPGTIHCPYKFTPPPEENLDPENGLAKRCCQPGTIHCPYKATPLELEFSAGVEGKVGLAKRCCQPGTIHCPYKADSSAQPGSSTKPETNENTGVPTSALDTHSSSIPSTKLNPSTDKLVILCGDSLNSCQVCRSPNTDCEAAHFEYDHDGYPHVCLKKVELFCAPLPLAIWGSLPEDVD